MKIFMYNIIQTNLHGVNKLSKYVQEFEFQNPINFFLTVQKLFNMNGKPWVNYVTCLQLSSILTVCSANRMSLGQLLQLDHPHVKTNTTALSATLVIEMAWAGNSFFCAADTIRVDCGSSHQPPSINISFLCCPFLIQFIGTSVHSETGPPGAEFISVARRDNKKRLAEERTHVFIICHLAVRINGFSVK